MSGPENNFIKSTHRHLPVNLYWMKNHNEYNSGIADVWYSGTKADLWVEFKYVKIPVRDSTVIDLVGGKNPHLSHLQQEWLSSRFAEGRNVGVVVGSEKGGVWLPGLVWQKPITAGVFRANLRSRKELASVITSLVEAT